MTKILVVVDMQNDFIDGALGTKEAQAIVPKVVKKISDFEGMVFATLDTHNPNYLDTLEGKHLPLNHCTKYSEGWCINQYILNVLNEKEVKFVEKPTFGSTTLVEELELYRYMGNVEIQLVGLCTDICVVSNAILLKAYFPEVEITVDASCCAGVTPETHKAALETMKMCQINVIGEDKND